VPAVASPASPEADSPDVEASDVDPVDEPADESATVELDPPACAEPDAFLADATCRSEEGVWRRLPWLAAIPISIGSMPSTRASIEA
jgi:hypothetical protein